MALRVIKQNPGLTYNEFYTRLRMVLPSNDYPQTPQLEGSDAHKGTLLFAPFAATPVPPGPTPTPEPTPTPTPEPAPGCISGLVQQVRKLFGG